MFVRNVESKSSIRKLEGIGFPLFFLFFGGGGTKNNSKKRYSAKNGRIRHRQEFPFAKGCADRRVKRNCDTPGERHNVVEVTGAART